jgi:thioredoxin reductase (NADPH)
VYDCLIVGGGPAGLSAAIYMGRFLRTVLVLDEGRGRSSFAQINDNYLGFPEGVAVKELRELGEKQAQRFGAQFSKTRVDKMRREPDQSFVAETPEGEFRGKTVVLCAGVRDIWPPLPDVLDYVGKTLFWCITCDGFRTLNKRVVCFGFDDEGATTACQFLLYSKEVTFVYDEKTLTCSKEKMSEMEGHKIKLVKGTPCGVDGTPEKIEAVVLQDGTRVPADIMFSLLGCLPNNKLALDLGVECSRGGYVKVDQEGYTSVSGVFCAGDLSRMHSHQVVAAAHEGAEAAQTCNYWLYSGFQREAPEHPTKPELAARVRSSG